MEIRKAIISVAGWGTRRLPITKVIEKAMLPVGNRPIVDYVVEDCVRAGVREIFVVTDDKPMSQVEAYYRNNTALSRYLIARGKDDALRIADTRSSGVQMHFLGQKDIEKMYGTAVPVALAVKEFNIDEPVVVLMGDDFIWEVVGDGNRLGLGEDGSAGIASALGRVPDFFVFGQVDFGLVLLGFGFLKAENVRVKFGNKFLERAFADVSTNAVDVPRKDFHLSCLPNSRSRSRRLMVSRLS